MSVLDSRCHRWLEIFSNFLLDLLWLLACLPVITIYPATAAIFGVVRDWVKKKAGSALQAFLSRFKENFRQSLVIGLVWTFFGVASLLDFYLVDQTPSSLRVVLGILLFVAALLYVFTSLCRAVSSPWRARTALWDRPRRYLLTNYPGVAVGPARLRALWYP